MRRRLACVPKFSAVATMPVPKYACQTRLTMERAVVGDCRSTSQRANVSRFARRVWPAADSETPARRAAPPDRAAESRRASGCASARWSSPRSASTSCERSFGMLAPQRRDRVVRPPSTPAPWSASSEDVPTCSGERCSAGTCENLANVLRHRIGDRVRGGRDRQADAAEIVVLVVVGIRAAVVLLERNVEHRAPWSS